MRCWPQSSIDLAVTIIIHELLSVYLSALLAFIGDKERIYLSRSAVGRSFFASIDLLR